MKSLRLFLTICLLAVAALAQLPGGPSRAAGTFYAAEYGQWVLYTTTNTGGGLGSSLNLSAGVVTLSSTDATIYGPFQRTPLISVLVDSGASQETVAISNAFNCSSTAPYGQCVIAGNFSKAHGQGARVSSGTFGLQDAITTAIAAGGGVVVVDQTWATMGGTTVMITNASGSLAVSILDNRNLNGAAPISYVWNGTNYIPANGTTYSGAAFGMKCDGTTNDTTIFQSILTTIGAQQASIQFPLGRKCLLGTATIPPNVMLDFSTGGAIQMVTGTTLNIQGGINDPDKHQIFYNAITSQGTISFASNFLVSTFYPTWWGPHSNQLGDIGPLQAATQAADSNTSGAAGGATIDLGIGTYGIGTTQWVIASPTTVQHHLSIIGNGPNATVITSTVSGSTCAIYMALEKYITVRGGFALTQTGGSTQGTGLCLTGDAGTGTQTNGSTFENITVSGFNHGVDTQGTGLGTSSELFFNNLVLNSNTTGFFCNNFNALNFQFQNLQMNSNTTGVNKGHSCNITVNGGDAETNGTAFLSTGDVDSPSTLNGYRIGLNGNNLALQCSGNFDWWQIDSMVVTGATTPNANNAFVIQQGCRIQLNSSKIGGQLVWNPGNQGMFSIKDTCVVDPNNTWTLANQTASAGFGPGFRLQSGGQDGAPWISENVKKSSTNCDDNTSGYFATSRGFLRAIGGGNLSAITTWPHVIQVGSGAMQIWGLDQDVQCTAACTVTINSALLNGFLTSTSTNGTANKFCVFNSPGVATIITLAALGNSAAYGKTNQSGYGTAGTGTATSAGANGDGICFIDIDATHLQVLPNQFVGTWTMN